MRLIYKWKFLMIILIDLKQSSIQLGSFFPASVKAKLNPNPSVFTAAVVKPKPPQTVIDVTAK